MGLKKEFLMGLCADIWFVPADKMGAIQSLCSSGDGNQGIRSLLSHAGFCIRDTVRQYRIQLHFISIRTPWLPPFVLCVS